MRKANRPLRQASLTALDALVVHHSAALQDPDAVALVTEAASLVNDGDVALASLALSLSGKVDTTFHSRYFVQSKHGSIDDSQYGPCD